MAERMKASRFRAALEELCGPVADAQARELLEFAGALRRRGGVAGLMSRSALDAVEEHILDSASLLSVCSLAGESVADVGSGGGLPGIVIGILEASASVTLIEASQRKAAFLKGLVRRRGLEGVCVVHARAEALAGGSRYDTVLARAVGPAAEVIPVCLSLVAEGGRLVLYKGPRWSDEEEQAHAAAVEAGAEVGWVRTVELPGLGRSNVFVEFHVKHPER